jgi:hypothetical protein
MVVVDWWCSFAIEHPLNPVGDFTWKQRHDAAKRGQAAS